MRIIPSSGRFEDQSFIYKCKFKSFLERKRVRLPRKEKKVVFDVFFLFFCPLPLWIDIPSNTGCNRTNLSRIFDPKLIILIATKSEFQENKERSKPWKT